MTQLRRLREAKGMRQERLAADAEVSISTIRAHESGRAQGVETKTAEAIARVLDVPVHELFFDPSTFKNVENGQEVSA
ncbi:helix-turn-helix transcriptional regulator [Deinococcus pimensis]|uniref:helix-turn-helix transcriptional regulator n=1 Tax=Deinococcus pimensis TaxID=309888 RepID=UPI00146FA9E0|nr:helix-turn-helix transcriptional regulator [Deinococcus pimensis]